MRRNMNRRNNVSNNAGGPLMTGHLKDIDLELELLKRKREMIEQQQQLLVMEQQFKSTKHYDMRYNEPQQHGSDRDYTHLYDNAPKQQNQFRRKRQAEPQWQYEGSFKRTNQKKKPNQSHINPRQVNIQGQHRAGNGGPPNVRNQRPMSGSGFGPKAPPKGPMPLMGIKIKQSIGQKISNKKTPNISQKEFTPTKVSKPKASPAPNKIASKPLAERESLVSAANESVSEADGWTRMLLPDRVPTQQVSGRLELALGAIMKNIRELIGEDSAHASMLRSTQLQRVMKQAIRERIRTVMLGKVVGSLLEILAVYREEFPEETDIDIINIALEAAGVPESERQDKVIFIHSDDPEKFFKMNMTTLIETKLNEMFAKLEEIYNEPKAAETELDLQKNAEEKDENKQDELQEYRNFLNMNVKPRDVKRFLPRLIKRYIPYIIKLINVDAMYQTTKAAITMKANQKASAIFSNKQSGENQDHAETTVLAQGASNEARQTLPYYVKIMGRPTLPKRKVMQGFLRQFNPKSIKKHRTIHNLLFVGFSEKSDYDVMVGADGTVVGKSTLSVRICSNSRDSTTEQNGENNDTGAATDVSQNEVRNDPKSEGEIITAELDCQITDLLSSIRKSEEAETKENIETTDDKTVDNVEEKAEAEQTVQEKEDAQKDDEMNVNDNSEVTDVTDNSAEAAEKVFDSNDANDAAEKDYDSNDANDAAEEKEISDNAENAVLCKDEAEEKELSDNAENPELCKDKAEEKELSDNAENPELCNDTEKSEETMDTINPETLANVKTDPQKVEDSSNSSNLEVDQSENDKVGDLKNNATASGRSTPSRTSARLANVTPSTIRTRRASRLAQN